MDSQVRPLAGLDPEDQIGVWNQAVQDSPLGNPTGKQVQAAKEKLVSTSDAIRGKNSGFLKNPKRFPAMVRHKLTKKTDAAFDRFLLKFLIKFDQKQHPEIVELIISNCQKRLEEPAE